MLKLDFSQHKKPRCYKYCNGTAIRDIEISSTAFESENKAMWNLLCGRVIIAVDPGRIAKFSRSR